MDKAYADTVRLLLQVAPDVFADTPPPGAEPDTVLP